MPRRKVIFANGEIYHLFNRTIGNEVAFGLLTHNKRALRILDYYRFPQIKKYSDFIILSKEDKARYLGKIRKTAPLVEVYAFVFMPNHFHFLVKQVKDKGIPKFVANFQNSFAKYFNLRNNRLGSLFQNSFKATRIETEEQLLHVSRYIHLNPVTASMIKKEELFSYRWNSFVAYGGEQSLEMVSTDLLLSFFKSKQRYKEFVFDQADYQRKLHKIRHLLIENP